MSRSADTTSATRLSARPELPAWVRVGAVAFAVTLAVANAREYGPANLLWFSNLAVLLLAAGAALRSPLLASMAAVAVTIPEIGWSADFLAGLARGLATGGADWRGPWGVSGYLWDPSRPAWVRSLALYHLALPPGLWWMAGRLGYDRRAVWAWSVLALCVYAVVRFGTDPADNINRAFSLSRAPRPEVSAWAFLPTWAAVSWGGFWLPAHLLFRWGRPTPADRALNRALPGKAAAG